MKAFFTHADPVVPVHHPRVLFETAVGQGADRAALLENVGITEATLASPDARLSYLQFAMLTSNALRLTNNPALGLDFGNNLHLAQMGVLGLAMLSSATLREAFDVALRHYRHLAPAWDLSLRTEGKRAVMTAVETIPLQPFRVFATEALLAAVDRLGRHFMGGPCPVLRMQVHYPKPDHAARYRELYDVAIEYDAEVTQVEFEAAMLDRPITGADPATARIAAQLCAVEDARAPSKRGLPEQVRQLLSGTRGRPPTAEAAARTLRTSVRSLRRALQNMGTSYQELLDEARRERAVHFAEATGMTVREMAEELGFSDLRSFRRAFRRWTGSTPQAIRAAKAGISLGGS